MKDQQLLDTSFGQKNKGLNSQLCGRKRFLSARSIGRRLFGGIYAPADWAIECRAENYALLKDWRAGKSLMSRILMVRRKRDW